ncbi:MULTISPECIES: DUF397 domain-containing protein [Streptomyces]|uniref:DUF397 domain-containing protein n=1 Tax=Streptomyces parvulus TaxID=146923 RepID=A0A191V3A9_9ACTN|nr:DUF397 domain-containing protein [Streptomyces parvulus]ANJ09506.1 DUF397 domain-containing protein [Streptomyces parvulus]GGR59305.1 hypothetical protein GCM10010220_06940 [Streptomyces parvulus]
MTYRMGEQSLGLAWFKSSYSSGEGGQCLEVATAPGTVHVRDSKRPTDAIMTVSPQAWAGLVALAVTDLSV